MDEGSALPAFAPLHRHRLRRRQNIPTISVLVGPPSAAEWIWTAWHRASGQRTVVVDGYSEQQVLRAWLADENVQRAISVALRGLVAQRCDVSEEQCDALLASRSPSQLDELLAPLLPLVGCSKQMMHLALSTQPPAVWLDINVCSDDFAT